MKRRKRRPVQRLEPAGPRVTCSIDCGNTDCPANLRKVGKGERFTVDRLIGGGKCRGYIRP